MWQCSGLLLAVASETTTTPAEGEWQRCSDMKALTANALSVQVSGKVDSEVTVGGLQGAERRCRRAVKCLSGQAKREVPVPKGTCPEL